MKASIQAYFYGELPGKLQEAQLNLNFREMILLLLQVYLMEYWEHDNIRKLFIVYLKLKINWYPMFLFAQSGQPTSVSLQKICIRPLGYMHLNSLLLTGNSRFTYKKLWHKLQTFNTASRTLYKVDSILRISRIRGTPHALWGRSWARCESGVSVPAAG